MRLIARVAVRAGWMGLVVLLHTAAAFGQTSARTNLRSPAQGSLADGPPLYSAPAARSEDVLLEMAGRASTIFVGRVAAVRRPADDVLRTGSAGAVVEVDFAVQRAIRGTAGRGAAVAGAVYTLREWAGLWRDNPRFLPGQRFLMLLHASGPGGLSSPVDGLDGAIPVRGGDVEAAVTLLSDDQKLRANEQTGGTTSDDQVDMRWLQAKTLKMPTYSDAPTASPGVTATGGGGPVSIAADPIGVQAAGNAAAGAATSLSNVAATDPLSRVLGLLGSVEALNTVAGNQGTGSQGTGSQGTGSGSH